ncbi:MAG: TatD family hydrolase [Candidatus Fibromonas sp.]|jgi:TatD DNase family protein|nr:TatD family hydrolase [Candidatus Fibromonas sp.]
MQFIDTHCHIDTILERTGGSAEALFEQMDPAPEAIIHVACDPDDFNWGKEFLLKKTLSGVGLYGVFGVHPLVAEKYSEAAEAKILEYLKLPDVLALGEIGLDYHYPDYNADLQKKVFLRQLEIGLELKKNLVFHLREADGDAFNILQGIDSENIKAHIHCYTGSASFAEKVLSLRGNYFFGFTGALTFNKTETIREAAAAIPLNKILLETDAPYLAPVPFRGKTCTPAMIPKIAQVLANIKNIPLSDLLKKCRENTAEMYGF